MSDYIFSPIANSFGVLKYRKKIPFNREIIKAVKFLERKYNFKLNKPIFNNVKNSFYTACCDRKGIYLKYCTIQSLFHEIHHFLQRKRGFNLDREVMNWHFYLSHRYDENKYFSLPSERDANKSSKKDYLEFSRTVLNSIY